tara:strand:+ start:785 stop:1279 length:495 start_codon:yes stop_codon:yes gene_type:complete
MNKEDIINKFEEVYNSLIKKYPKPRKFPTTGWIAEKDIKPNKIYLWVFGGSGGLEFGNEQDLIMIPRFSYDLALIADKSKGRAVDTWIFSRSNIVARDGNIFHNSLVDANSNWINFNAPNVKLSKFGIGIKNSEDKFLFGPLGEIKEPTSYLNWTLRNPMEVKE